MKWQAAISLPIVIAAGSVSSANAATLSLLPTDMTGLRSFDNGANVLLLTFDAVKTSTGDRTIAHYELESLTNETISTATLTIPLLNLDPGGRLGTFEVYSFNGDGVVSTDEWASGTLIQVFDSVEERLPVLSLDVTSYIQDALSDNFEFLSFNFRADLGTDRYFLSDIVRLPEPAITLETLEPPASVPEPSMILGSITAVSIGACLKRRTST